MERMVFVHVDLDGAPRLVGRLWTRMRKDKETATFEYDRSWLERPDRFSLEPALVLDPGPFHAAAGKPMFGAIGDSAPDRWGRSLMRRAERRRAEREGGMPRNLHELDYLLLVDDEARQGALRFSESMEGPFLALHGAGRIPPLIELPKLLSAVERIVDDSDEEEDLRLLLAPGSSLGGARPKASIRDRDGSLAIAKFSHRDDETDLVRWEALANNLAKKAGLSVAECRLEMAAGKPVLLLKRFDRRGAARIPFIFDLAFGVASYFDLAKDEAESIVAGMGRIAQRWRAEAAALGIAAKDIDRMRSAFEHRDLDAALRLA